MNFPYRADHVGSLLRPPELLELARNRSASAQIRPVEDRSILQILQKQKDLGFKIFTDGEFRRQGFMSDFYESVEGLDEAGAIGRSWQGAAAAATDADTVPSYRIPGIVVNPIRQTRRLAAHESSFLRQHSPGDIKITLPTPNQFPAIAYKKGISDRVYPTYSEFLWALVPIFRSEIQALVNEGVKYIQIDAPRYSYYIDPKWRRYLQEEISADPEKALDEAIQVDNACLEIARRDGVIFAMHLCRGNNRSQWYAEGGYDPLAEKLFHRLNVDAFLLEYESERAGTFAPLRFMPPEKTVVLGLVSSKVPELEMQDQLLRRIEEAAKYVPLENLALSPQCGFASNMEGNLLTENEQWRKLELVVETARKVWKDA
jgi:5-methyltetrahydropteroyltriglutamate--homocysteine methyltransferase